MCFLFFPLRDFIFGVSPIKFAMNDENNVVQTDKTSDSSSEDEVRAVSDSSEEDGPQRGKNAGATSVLVPRSLI